MRGNNGITKSKLDKVGKRLSGDGSILVSDLELLNEVRFRYRDVIKNAIDFFSKPISKSGTFIGTSSSRLKRTPSVVSKLKRFSKSGGSTRLSSMQDIGGCRFIFENIGDLYGYVKRLESNLGAYKIKKKFNYIKETKPDGYKSIHYVIVCSETGLLFEIQLRTKAQHYWSTAVEILDMITNNPIKQGFGEPTHKRFFKMMSAIVALEDNIKESNRNRAKREIPILISKSNIIDKLKKRVMHYEFFNKNISKHLKRGYNKVWDSNLTGEVILVFTHKGGDKFDIEGKYNLNLEGAKEYYLEMEKICFDDANKDLVIISSSELVEAYPNYAGDAKKFIEIYDKYFN